MDDMAEGLRTKLARRNVKNAEWEFVVVSHVSLKVPTLRMTTRLTGLMSSQSLLC